MKILPCMSRGVVLVHEDDSFEMAPFQVFRTKDATVFRIGRNAFFFDDDGRYDGSEHQLDGVYGMDDPKLAAVNEALNLSGENKGLPPDKAYYPQGTPGYDRETAAWVNARPDLSGQNYVVKTKPRTH